MSSSSHWKSVKLGDVLRLINGRAYKKAEHLDSGTPVIRIQNLNGGARWFYSDLSLPDDKYCENGDLLFAWSASFGPYIWAGEKSIYHYHIWKVEVGDDLDKAFAYRLLEHLTQKIKDSGRGISMVHVTKSGMEAWEIRLPPLPEQKRIAAILDQADALRKHRQRALDHLNKLGQSIFYEMFGQPSNYSQTIVSLDEVSEQVDYGITASATDENTGHQFLRITDIQNNKVDWKSVPFCKASAKEIQKGLLRQGDIVFARTGATTGKSYLINRPPLNSVFASYLIRVRPNKNVNSTFLYEFFQTDDYWRQIEQKSVGAGQPGVNSSKLKELKLPLPILENQLEFENKIDQISLQKEVLNADLLAKDKLFASLQQRAFRGEL